MSEPVSTLPPRDGDVDDVGVGHVARLQVKHGKLPWCLRQRCLILISRAFQNIETTKKSVRDLDYPPSRFCNF